MAHSLCSTGTTLSAFKQSVSKCSVMFVTKRIFLLRQPQTGDINPSIRCLTLIYSNSFAVLLCGDLWRMYGEVTGRRRVPAYVIGVKFSFSCVVVR